MGRKSKGFKKKVAIWSHDFVCLARTGQTKTPSAVETAKLMGAGLGRKQLTFIECEDSSDLHEELLSCFPALREAGGYELLRVSVSGRSDELEVVPIPHQGYTASYLKEVARQPKIYIRPLQWDLSLEPLDIDLDMVSLVKQVFQYVDMLVFYYIGCGMTACAHARACMPHIDQYAILMF